MLSSAYKKFASVKGLKCSKGICYGELNGFIVTLSEGAGYKEIYISASVNEESMQRISSETENFKKNYKLNTFEVNSKFIHVAFVDSIGIMKRIESFTNEVIPMLKEYGAKGSDTCPECQNNLDAGAVTKLIYGHAIKLHSSCAEEIINDMKESEQEIAETKSNAGLGIIGAILFGIIGAIPWAKLFMQWDGL